MSSAVLPRCLSFLQRKPKILSQTKQIHAQLITNGLNSPSILAKLIDGYCSSTSSASPSPSRHSTNLACAHALAHLVFAHFHPPNPFLFNTLLRCTKPFDSLRHFASWVSKSSLLFDEFTFLFLLGACARFASLSTLWFGRQVHGMVLKNGFLLEFLLLETTLIHFYGNNGDLLSTRKVFDEMRVRSSVTWNAMIDGYCSSKEKGNAREGLMLFREMLVDESGVRSTDRTIVCVLSGCSRLGVLETGACVHGYIEKCGFGFEEDVFIGTGLVDMYSKCGSLESAYSIFERMEARNILTWTSMAMGLAIHGKGKEALELLDGMGSYGLSPNELTFTSLLAACCHVGLVEEGLRLFRNMEEKFGVVPKIQHYGCIVDLLGRAGHLREAYEFILAVPVKGDDILWRSLLSACEFHGDAVMGEKVGKILLRRGQEEKSKDTTIKCEDYIALSNVYASAGRWQEVEMVRKEMKERRIQTKPGCSFLHTIKK